MVLLLLVLPTMKRDLYEIFLKTHKGCALFLLYATWRHTKNLGNCMRYLIACLALFTVTFILQTARILFRNVVVGKKCARLIITPGENNVQVMLTLPRPWKIRAGERINLNVPQIGLLSLFQAHPFVITWWDNDAAGYGASIALLFRPRSGFTRKLKDHIEPGQESLAWIDGPYGPSSVGLWGFSGQVGDYGHVFMVATGIGIAAQLPYIKELLDGRRQGQVRTQRITLVWQLEMAGKSGSHRPDGGILANAEGSHR